MLTVNNDQQVGRVGARIHEYLAGRQAWNRRLWGVGSALAIRELVEAIEESRNGTLSEEAVSYLANAASVELGPDAGAGDPAQRRLAQETLRKRPLRPNSLATSTLRAILGDIDQNYLIRWRDAAHEARIGSVERTARSIAAHLLDAGFSSSFLVEWWGGRLAPHTAAITLADLFDQASTLVRQPETTFAALIAFDSLARALPRTASGWMSGRDVVTWLRTRGHDTNGLRVHGGLLYSIPARDSFAAAEVVRERVDQLLARAALGTNKPVHVVDRIWIEGCSAAFAVARPPRGVAVHSLEREGLVIERPSHEKTESAIELLGVMNSGPPGAAVASGWAAIESLLLGAGEGVERVAAADRMADVVSCSFPRAELTTLGYRHSENSADELAVAIRGATDNRDRARLVAKHLIAGHRLSLRSIADVAAEERLLSILKNPAKGVSDVRNHIQQAARRLYRQRNLVMHGGVRSVALSSCLRTGAALVGACLDRIIHALFAEKVEPLDLAARAGRKLAVLQHRLPVEVTDLLEA